MQKSELVALLMESPFYFTTPFRERLQILKYNENRFSPTISREAPAAEKSKTSGEDSGHLLAVK